MPKTLRERREHVLNEISHDRVVGPELGYGLAHQDDQQRLGSDLGRLGLSIWRFLFECFKFCFQVFNQIFLAHKAPFSKDHTITALPPHRSGW